MNLSVQSTCRAKRRSVQPADFVDLFTPSLESPLSSAIDRPFPKISSPPSLVNAGVATFRRVVSSAIVSGRAYSAFAGQARRHAIDRPTIAKPGTQRIGEVIDQLRGIEPPKPEESGTFTGQSTAFEGKFANACNAAPRGAAHLFSNSR
jgi:hypothetical protein